MKAQFKNTYFLTQKEFRKWLKENSFKTIYLKDLGQDMLTIWIHETGEILHTDFNSGMYSGKFIDMSKLAIGNFIDIWDMELQGYATYTKLQIEDFKTK